MDEIEDHHAKFCSQNDRIVSPRADACLRAERRGDHNIDPVTASMFSGDLTGSGDSSSSFCRTCSLPECSDPCKNRFAAWDGSQRG